MKLYTLKGKMQGKEFLHVADDIRYLQELLTKVLMLNGTGFIYKGVLNG